jgi:hypothetical protein
MPTRYGKKNDLTFSGATFLERKDGLSTGEATWTCPNSIAISRAPLIGSKHPYVSWLKAEGRTITFGAMATIQLSYAGMNPSQQTTSTPVLEVAFGSNEEPIETHPEFVTDIAGKPSNPRNGAIFLDPSTGRQTEDDTRGVFEKFSILVEGIQNPFAGLSKYLDLTNITFRKKYTTRSRPATANGTYLDSPSGAPSIGSGRNWLYMGLSYEERGDVFSVVEEWRGSPRRGWNQIVYPQS